MIVIALLGGIVVWFGQMLWILGKAGAGIQEPSPLKKQWKEETKRAEFLRFQSALAPLVKVLRAWHPECGVYSDDELIVRGLDLQLYNCAKWSELVAAWEAYQHKAEDIDLSMDEDMSTYKHFCCSAMRSLMLESEEFPQGVRTPIPEDKKEEVVGLYMEGLTARRLSKRDLALKVIDQALEVLRKWRLSDAA
ncbi:MAG: hypothetical protein M3R04_03315 [bacterium]|nr:hypothetical protein [bacterium]